MKQTVLLKLSGEAISKIGGLGIDMKKVKEVAEEVKSLKDTGVSVAIVIGAGNMWRGRDAQIVGMPRYEADQMGMLGTVLNAKALASSLEMLNIKTHVMSSFEISDICQLFNYKVAKSALENGEIVVFAGGTGHPYFSTDTTAALRAAEIGADVILMAKNGTDGVYDSDPRQNPKAIRFEKITYTKVLTDHLQVMDSTAAAMCHDNNLKTIVFDMGVKGNITKVMKHPEIGTIITK